MAEGDGAEFDPAARCAGRRKLVAPPSTHSGASSRSLATRSSRRRLVGEHDLG